MQAAGIDHFQESHIFQGMKQDPRKKEAIMHMDQFLRQNPPSLRGLSYHICRVPGKNLYAPISSPSEVYQ